MAESPPSFPPETLKWLKSLPLAPAYHPTLAEFQDPISYISKIEKEASQYGICKIVPPLSQGSRATAITNFNQSLVLNNTESDSTNPPAFTTLKEQIGFGKKVVWQSGEYYSFKQFEAKAKKFEKTHFKGTEKEDLTEVEIETLFWKDWEGKPFSVEYANDIPGSAFVTRDIISRKGFRGVEEPETVGETSWNMRGVSREKGSLLRFVKEDIPGVTSPMMHLAMMFSWFGWHVENHDLYSLNYIHMGEAKTWYGVPMEAALAFEEVVRVNEFEGNANALVTCATLAKKATVTSPEVLISAGVPCCRLVQDAGEFVVTFPGAYYSGLSHGFNCAEATNIATPEWLKVAKKAAVRRASMNYPPMFSHLHLLYAHALSLYSRVPLSICTEPRSSRLKEKKRSEGEPLVKELFVQDVIQNNELLHVLLEQGSCVLLPQKFSNIFCSKRKLNGSHSGEPYSSSICERNRSSSCLAKYIPYENVDLCSSTSEIQDNSTEKGSASPVSGILDHGMFSCVMCGISNFACAAVIQPREAAAKYFASADCRFFKDSTVPSGTPDDEHTDTNWSVNTSELNFFSGQTKISDNGEMPKGISSLDLLAATYGNLSDSEDEKVDSDMPVTAQRNKFFDPRDTSESADEVLSSDSDCISDNTSDSLKPEPGDSDDEANSALYNHISSDVAGRIQNASHISWRPKARCRNNGRATANVKSKREQHLGGDSSKMHIFCLEHAVEVEKQLRSVGGMHVLLVCHPDYPRVETEAKVLAEELGIDHFWNDTSFREATKNDVARIESALNVEEAVPRNEDWSVKLGINLSYSASVILSPSYNKPVPSNSVICKAFGLSSPTNSSEEAVVSGKKPAKHNKKVVAGKWCGKVWTANQIHPFVERGVSQKEEPRKTFHPQAALELKSKIKSEVELSDQTEQPILPKKMATTVIKTYERKRKGAVKNEAIKKAKYLPETSSFEAAEDSPPQSESVLRRGQRKRKPSLLFDNTANSVWQCDPIIKQEAESGSVARPRRRPPSEPCEEEDVKPVTKKQSKKKVTPKKYKTIKEMEEPYHCDILECAMAFSSKQELALHKRNICLVEGCGKKFFSHKYLVQHKRVHTDDRPLKCPWKGCTMTFKWAWSRTEHIRVHTGVRPYECQEPGCGQTFRFVTDFSRHRRKTGHAVRKDKE